MPSGGYIYIYISNASRLQLTAYMLTCLHAYMLTCLSIHSIRTLSKYFKLFRRIPISQVSPAKLRSYLQNFNYLKYTCELFATSTDFLGVIILAQLAITSIGSIPRPQLATTASFRGALPFQQVRPNIHIRLKPP